MKTTRGHGVDPGAIDLAEKFLRDLVDPSIHRDWVEELAYAIQEAAEDWIDEFKDWHS